MTLEVASYIAGIVAAGAAVLGLIWVGNKIIRKKRHTQVQHVSGRGTGIQAGRDADVKVSHDKTDPKRK